MMDGKRVTGIKGHTHDGGNAVIERGHIVIGADGRTSKLARIVQAETYNFEPPLTCFYFAYFSGVENEGFELYARPRNDIFSFVTNDDLLTIFVCWPIARFPEIKSDIEAHFLGALNALGEFGERVQAGRREERFYGTADLPNFYRKRSARDGRSWAMPVITRIHTWRWVWPMRSVTRVCWRARSTTAFRGGRPSMNR